MLLEIYQTCSGIRDGMSASFTGYNAMIDIAKNSGVENIDDLLELTRIIENDISKKRDADSKAKK